MFFAENQVINIHVNVPGKLESGGEEEGRKLGTGKRRSMQINRSETM